MRRTLPLYLAFLTLTLAGASPALADRSRPMRYKAASFVWAAN